MENPNVAASIRLQDASNALNLNKQFGIIEVSLRGDKQILFADISFDKQFSAEDFHGLDKSTAIMVDALKPKVKGKLSIGLGLVSAASAINDGKFEIRFQLLPLFRSINIDQVSLAENKYVTATPKVAASLLNRYADNVSGALSRSEFTKITVPALLETIPSTNALMEMKNDQGVSTSVSVVARPIALPLYLKAAAILIDSDRISVMTDLELAEPGSVKIEPVSGDFDGLQKAFADKIAQGFEAQNQTAGNWVGLSKALIGSVVNSAINRSCPSAWCSWVS